MSRSRKMFCILLSNSWVPATTMKPKKKLSHNFEMNNEGILHLHTEELDRETGEEQTTVGS